MKKYTVKDLQKLTGRSKAQIYRWLNGQNKKGIKLKSTLPSDTKGHTITEKDLKEFFLALKGM